MADNPKKFVFHLLQGKEFPSLSNKDNQDYLMKWSMKGRITAQAYSFDQMFQAYEKDQFVLDFFRDENVVSTLQMLSSSGKWTPVDELRQMLLNEDSDSFCVFNETDREEFLFHLFQHICLGGQVCQYEDTVDPYLDFTKQLYKDLITVQKKSETKELFITSSVFKVTAAMEEQGGGEVDINDCSRWGTAQTSTIKSTTSMTRADYVYTTAGLRPEGQQAAWLGL
ncbi:hypothetical protein C0Q70_21566 [Pomacea canaliculata]|uniref:Cilia- and flagella-associated protein 300 n=1 Tax=Pomacea canaliculata TaxID=400727 RepID=A0A2T7NCX1_POMCA|nr:hypothetical protein C0Q70_21566 [Pomacea canaliculata]